MKSCSISLHLHTGAATTLEGSQTPKSERRLVQSHERKSIFKKKKNKNTPDNSPRGSRTTTPVPDGSESPPQSRASPTKGHRLQVSSGKEEKKGFKLSKKSFRKVAKVVRISRSISKDRDKDKDKSKRDSVDEQDGEVTPSGAVASIDCEDESKESTSESHRKRPQNIPLQPESQFVFEPSSSSTGSGSKQTVNTPMIQGPARSVYRVQVICEIVCPYTSPYKSLLCSSDCGPFAMPPHTNPYCTSVIVAI